MSSSSRVMSQRANPSCCNLAMLHMHADVHACMHPSMWAGDGSCHAQCITSFVWVLAAGHVHNLRPFHSFQTPVLFGLCIRRASFMLAVHQLICVSLCKHCSDVKQHPPPCNKQPPTPCSMHPNVFPAAPLHPTCCVPCP